jgi:hypothetical protein
MRLRSSDSDRRLLPEYASATHLDTRSHGNTRGSTALLPWRTDALLPLAWRISSIYLYSPDQLSADAILSCNRDRIARLNWYHMRKSPGGAASCAQACNLYHILHVQLAAWPTSSVQAEITPQRPLSCDHLDGRLPSENRLRTGFLCACSKHTSVLDLFQLEDACKHLVRVVRCFLPRDRWVIGRI